MYISLGIDCAIADILKEQNLRKCSLPFDWIVTYEGVANIIDNEFQNYIPEDNQFFNNDSTPLNIYYGVRFHHNVFPQDREVIIKRVERFKYILENSQEKIIFIRKGHMEYHHTEYENDIVCDIADAIQLDKVLIEKYPKLNYKIHVISTCSICSKFQQSYDYDNLSSNLHFHNLDYNPDYENFTVELTKIVLSKCVTDI
jgi:hypothetical protein